MDLKTEIKTFFKGEVKDDKMTLLLYSHDASLFTVVPKLVVFPLDTEDLENLVIWLNEHKKHDPSLSITIRAAGSCMSGGPLGESIIADVTKHMNRLVDLDPEGAATVEPGLYYRDFEPQTLEDGLILPCYTASKSLNALGGMFGNNSAGEKTLRYGKMENYVLESKIVFADGKERDVKPLNRSELMKKIRQRDFEGRVYRDLFNLLEDHKDVIEAARPHVSKNSAGYYLWNVWDGETFDLNKLLVGSQGTLGLMTEMKIRLVPVEPASGLFVIFLPDLKRVADLVNDLLPTNPDSIESFDDATLKLAFRFLPEMIRSMKPKHFFKMIFSFLPEALMMLRGGMPKLILLVEYAGKDAYAVKVKMEETYRRVQKYGYATRIPRSIEESQKYWTIRRESFNLLRKHVKGKRTAPFVDDVIVMPKYMPAFLPKMQGILNKYGITSTIAGHAGNGNFHVIPLMDMHNKGNIEIIKNAGNEIYDLVAKYHGSITAEHNDGIVRTPYLGKMFSSEMLELFQEVKKIFDPLTIFNPGKKVGGTIDYLASHIQIEK